MTGADSQETDVAIVGAGPYGLSIAAYLKAIGLSFRIFGRPMLSWRDHMPRGMCLKSEGYASNLFDPQSAYPLSRFCSEAGLPYADIGTPVTLETFVAYGEAFQNKFVPELERTEVRRVAECPGGFEIALASGETLRARRAIVASGIAHFGYLPPVLSGHSTEFVSHSYEHADVSRFRNRTVAVVGSGASAIDLASALHLAGAEVHVLARREAIEFHKPPRPRSLWESVRSPRSRLGFGWKSWFCTNAPLLFHALPVSLRIRAVERHLGPSSGWFMKDRVIGKFPFDLGSNLTDVKIRDGKALLTYRQKREGTRSLAVDHVIGATGYRVDLDRCDFIDRGVRDRIRRVGGSPVLDRNFETSVRNFYMTGVASAYSFGPLMRFALGAKFTASRLTKHLRRTR